MSDFHITLFKFKSPQTNENVVYKVHQGLSNIGCSLEKEGTIIVFNDCSSGDEREEYFIDESLSDSEILRVLTDWKSLGLIDYSSETLGLIFSVNFISNGVESIYFDIGIPKSAFHDITFEAKYQRFISLIATELDLARYCYDTGQIDYSNNIDEQLNRLKLDHDVTM